MRKIQWTEVQASTEGEFAQLDPGAYVAVIQSVEDVESKQYVRVLFDIADGEHAGFFSDQFYKDKPWAHNFIMSYKDTALGMLKGRLETIAACNPGFDPFAAWDAGRLDMFAGRKFGAVLRKEEYWDKKNDEFKLGSPKFFRMCKLEDVTSGKYAEVKPKMLSDDEKRDALADAGYGEGDISLIMMAPAQAAAAPVHPANTYNENIPF